MRIIEIIEIIKIGIIIIGACANFATFGLFWVRRKERQEEKLERLTDKIKKSRILLSENYKKILVKLYLLNSQNDSFSLSNRDENSEWVTSSFGMELIWLQITFVTNSVDELYIILNLLKELPRIDRELLQEISKYNIDFTQAIWAHKSEMEKLMKLKCKDKDHFNSMFMEKFFDYHSCFKFKEVIDSAENLIYSLQKMQKFTEIYIELRRFFQQINILFIYLPEYQKHSIPEEKSS